MTEQEFFLNTYNSYKTVFDNGLKRETIIVLNVKIIDIFNIETFNINKINYNINKTIPVVFKQKDILSNFQLIKSVIYGKYSIVQPEQSFQITDIYQQKIKYFIYDKMDDLFDLEQNSYLVSITNSYTKKTSDWKNIIGF